jgi:hypothetical protein
MWVSPIKKRKTEGGSDRVAQTANPPSVIEKFKAEKLTLPKSEARKILHHSGELSYSQIAWTQRWLEQRIRENSLPPQLSKNEAFGAILKFLSPLDASSLLNDVRTEFQRNLPPSVKEADDFAFLTVLANEAYHEHLPPPHTSAHNSHLSDDDL